MMLRAKICYGLSAVVCLICPVWGTAQVCARGEEQASFITFQVPGSSITVANAINNSGAIAGAYVTGSVHGFVRAANGAIATFDAPGSVSTEASSINDGGAITGEYQDAKGISHGFVRSALGTITTFNAPGNAQYDIYGTSINAAGTITGVYGPTSGQQPQGFVRSASGVITSFDVPGSMQISPRSINAEGLVTGYYSDAAT
jgi:predicted membrane protein